jgi:aryl-alcohol dehydrogenase-like predicted oxidoreductase
MQALHDVVQAGYVRYIGMSSCYAYQCRTPCFRPLQCANNTVVVAQMQNYAITNKLTPFISMQNHYNVIYREEEREMIPTLKVGSIRLLLFSCL